MPSFNFNAIYEPVFFSQNRYKDIWGGRGRGGSHFGTDYFLFLITQKNYFRGYFVRQIFDDIKGSLFQDIKDRIEENKTLDINDFKINEANYSLTYKPTGNQIISKGVSGQKQRTAKMKSIAGATHVLIEEADELGQTDFDQLDLSLRTVKTKKIEVIRIFNPPYKDHWIWKRDYNLIEKKIKVGSEEKIYYTAEPKSKSDVLSIHSTYMDNIVNLQESFVSEIESRKDTDMEYYCTQVLGLISEGVKGRIYSGWKIISDKEYDELDLPKVYAIDFGYSDHPSAILEVKYSKNYRYFRQLLYESHLDNISFAKRLIDLGVSPTTDIIVADPGNGGDLRIAELRRGWRGIEGYPNLCFNIRSTIKGPGSIKFGINKVKECHNYMTESSKDGWTEYQEYKWALDINKNPTDNPVDENNHLMDCRRYFELCKGKFY
jgi:phage terminase large subunit